MKNIKKRKALGAKRAKVTYLIKHEMKIRGYDSNKLALAVGVVHSAVSRVINGGGHSEQILDALRVLGVPEKLLFDPRYCEAPARSKRRP